MKPHLKKKLEMASVILLTFLFLIIIAGVIDGVRYFWIGFHNIDLSVNIMRIECSTTENCNMGLADWASDGNQYSYLELYRAGLKQLTFSLYYTSLGSFILGFLVCMIFILLLKKEEKPCRK